MDGVSPEFPSDNPELWRARPPSVMLALLPESEPEPEVEVADFDDADFAEVETVSSAPPASLPCPEDPFQLFVRTLVEVSLAAGAPARVVAILPGMLGAARLDVHALDPSTLDKLVAANVLARTETGAITRSESLVTNVQAWRATLLGEEAVLSVSSTLDEWSAHIIATLAAAPERKEALRRELRSRGIAAFGMILAA